MVVDPNNLNCFQTHTHTLAKKEKKKKLNKQTHRNLIQIQLCPC